MVEGENKRKNGGEHGEKGKKQKKQKVV